MTKVPDYEKIVAAAGSRANVSITNDDLVKLRGCRPESALGRWIEKNLTTDTLLSSEELRISEAIPEHGLVSARSAFETASAFVPLNEDELLAAIADLEASTKALNCQSSELEAKRTFVGRRYDGRPQARTRSGSLVSGGEIEQRNTARIQRLKSEIHEVQNEIEELFRNSRDAIEKSSRRIPSMLSELTNSNDRTLADLAKQHSAGASTELGTSTSLDTVNRLTSSLSKMISEELQCRLDRTYLENLRQGDEDNVNGDQRPATEEAQVLEEDLRSLYTEIPDVAEMFVAQKYREPLVQMILQEEQQRTAVASLHAQGVTSQLSTLTNDLDALTRRLQAFHSYRCVIQNLQASYDHFKTSSSISTSSPTKINLQPPQHNVPALEALQRHFGLSAASPNDLYESIKGKIARLREDGRGSIENISSDTKATLVARKKVVESLLQSIDQSDEDSLARLAALEARIKTLREDVEAVSVTDRSHDVRKQMQFTEKWS
jgi:hypothetical protein